MSPEMSIEKEIIDLSPDPTTQAEAPQNTKANLQKDFAVPIYGQWDGEPTPVELFTFQPENEWHPALDD